MKDIYEPIEALRNGTLFKDLYRPYKFEVPPLTYKDKEDRAEGIIREFMFALIEVNLYLDTHPTDKDFLKLREVLANEYKKVLAFYAQNYSALSPLCEQGNEFTYATARFPWEVNN